MLTSVSSGIPYKGPNYLWYTVRKNSPEYQYTGKIPYIVYTDSGIILLKMLTQKLVGKFDRFDKDLTLNLWTLLAFYDNNKFNGMIPNV